MPNTAGIDFAWWVTAIEIPVISVVFWLIWRLRQTQERQDTEMRLALDRALSDARSNLAAFKLEVAKSYVSIPYLKDVERRLTHHLLRIEVKLDTRRASQGEDE